MADAIARDINVRAAPRMSARRLANRKSFTAFLFALPLILIIVCLVVYPAFYSLYLSMLNKSMTKFSWVSGIDWLPFGNIQFLFKRSTFWMVVEQSCLFAVTAVIFKAILGFVIAHF